MNEDLRRRISAAVDSPVGIDGDAQLMSELALDPDLDAYARDVAGIAEAMRAWPEPVLEESAWEALAMRVEARLGDELAPMPDPVREPAFDVADARHEVLRNGGVMPSVAPSTPVSRPPSRMEQDVLRRLDEFESRPTPQPDRPMRLPNPTDVKPSIPEPDRGERFSLTDVMPAAPLPRLSFNGTDLSGPPESFIGPTTTPKRGRGWMWGGAAFVAVAAGAAAVLVVQLSGSSSLAPSVARTVDAPAAAPWQQEEGAAQATATTSDTTGDMPSVARAAPGVPTPQPSPSLEPPAGASGAAAMNDVLLGARPMESHGGATARAGSAWRSEMPERMQRSAASGVRTPLDRTGNTNQPAHRAELPENQGAAAAPGEAFSAPRPRPPAPRPENVPTTLDRQAVVDAMASVRAAVLACAEGRHGIASVRVTIQGTGRVSSAVVSGEFAGTPQGSCVARAVRQATFPPFSEAPLVVTYPFALQ